MFATLQFAKQLIIKNVIFMKVVMFVLFASFSRILICCTFHSSKIFTFIPNFVFIISKDNLRAWIHPTCCSILPR